MIDDPILSTLAQLVSLHDGIVEPAGNHSLSVLLTENIAKILDVGEEVTFSTRADIPNSSFVTYHSELLKKFDALLQIRGAVTALEVKYNGYLKTTGFDKLLLQKIAPQNGLLRYLDAKPATTRYLWCHVAYTAEADEKRIGMVSFIINELTKVTPVDIGDALLWESDIVPVDNTNHPPMMAEEELSNLIEQTSTQLIKTDLENWSAKLNRARARDEERLKTYYGTIAQEIRSKLEFKQLEGEDKQKELARIEATHRELDRKLADVQERYAMRVEAYLHSAMIIYLPTVHIQCELIRKKAQREVIAVWNPFTKIIEPLRCEVSGEPVYNFYLDDDDAKIISPTIWKER
ncbi:hypothetical protein Cri9333_0533 [Crinalium epipsammum PCC 9333]|uniref:Uncharacterized protein n=1 Tax=Crinalium epipsammum PCC 9333 TaxID=1173022 RepID=K9VTT4_9CYAN|nr:hypothetical protein [Crinalium epipsammum]AFZ11488.1 hypothetical protein Cri9333_0533 [Crinalium epipsammum PCC 9333]